MATDKRARQKAGRQARLEALVAQQKKDKRRKTIIRGSIGVVAVLLLALLWSLLTGDDGDDEVVADDTTTTVAADDGTFTYGTTPCPPVDGAATPTKTFDDAFQQCIDPAKAYTATFETSAGTIVATLDTSRTPGTTNNFVSLARAGYYDDTSLFRTDPSIAIIQGGGSDNSADTGYNIPDEGGSFTYERGQLVMARTPAPDSAGGQFFFTTGPETANLDSDGTYVVFGTVTEGLDVLDAIMATHVPGGSLGGAPDPDVTVTTVTITET